MKLWTLLIIPALSLTLAACGENGNYLAENSQALPTCGGSTAEIAVTDGFLRDLCGCQEASGTTTGPGESLTCTIRAGSNIVFQYIATTVTHQIISNGTPAFVSSAINDPNRLPRFRTVQSHGVNFPV